MPTKNTGQSRPAAAPAQGGFVEGGVHAHVPVPGQVPPDGTPLQPPVAPPGSPAETPPVQDPTRPDSVPPMEDPPETPPPITV